MSDTRTRIFLSLFGATAGFAVWALFEWLDQQGASHLLSILLVFVLVGAKSVLVLTGPLTWDRAVIGAAVLALGMGALTAMGSLRFEAASQFWEGIHPAFALFGVSFVALPFVITTMRQELVWSDYGALFAQAWEMSVRSIVAWAFVGVVWGLIALSGTVLGIVGIEIIDELLRIDPVPLVITGAALGLGFAILFELRDTIRPALVLRLLRVMLPAVLLVSVVFLLGVIVQSGGPVRGLFRGLSPAAMLMVLGFAAAGLITTALDTDDQSGVQGKWMTGMTRAMATVLPLLAGVALYGVFVRFWEYGWTPDRLVALTIALLLLAYGVIYCAAVVRGGAWQSRVRQSNVWLALAVIGVTALWFTPLLNPQKISTSSQIARFERGATKVADLPLYEMAQKWGTAGQAGLGRLEAMSDHPEATVLAQRVALARKANNRRAVDVAQTQEDRTASEAIIRENIIVLPQGARLPDGVLAAIDAHEISRLKTRCLPDEETKRTGCAAVVMQTQQAGDVVIVMMRMGTSVRVSRTLVMKNGTWGGARLTYLDESADRRMLWSQIEAGDIEIGPAQGTVLRVGPTQIYPYN